MTTALDVGNAYWTHRAAVGAEADRIRAMARIVDAPTSLSLPQWAMLMSVVMEFKPDLVIELGRGNGNSTCAFAEAAALAGLDTRVLSICRSRTWGGVSKQLRPIMSEEWFARIDARQGNIVGFPFAREIGDARRVLVFWDAHGFEVASEVLTQILPVLASREHLVLMHDISDTRYDERDPAYEHPIWSGEHADGHYFRIANMESSVGQAIAILDFAGRNRLPLRTADESIDGAVVQSGREGEMQAALGDLYSSRGHFTYFSLAEAERQPLTFPPPLEERSPGLLRRVKQAILVLLGYA
ncbi:MAG: hypothetical protein AB7F65_09590 [Dehalococcoidia bacterium]